MSWDVSWVFLAPGLHLNGPALMSHCDYVSYDKTAKEDDGPFYNNILGATKICTLSIGTKIYTKGGIGPLFPIWMEHLPQISQITEETTLATMPW